MCLLMTDDDDDPRVRNFLHEMSLGSSSVAAAGCSLNFDQDTRGFMFPCKTKELKLQQLNLLKCD